MKRLIIFALISIGFSTPIFAQYNIQELGKTQQERMKYLRCIALAETDPLRAKEMAQNLKKDSDIEAANHCFGIALINLGQHKEAASLLTFTAKNSKLRDPELLANMFAQAANAWMIAGSDSQAAELLDTAITLAPREPEYFIDRAIALAGQSKYWDALDNLNEAISIEPERVDALTLRASAWRRVGSIELAAQDIKEALRLQPDYPEALLERGLINAIQGDQAAARSDWIKILRYNVSDPLNKAAKTNLQKLKLSIRHK